MSGPELVVLGCLTLDNVMTATGECLPETPGGNALYAALGARVWSDRVGVVSRYGTGYPEKVFDLLRGLGIDPGGIRHLGVPHGRRIAFCYSADGSRSRIFPPDAVARIPPSERARFVDVSLLPDARARWTAFAPDAEDIPPLWWDGIAGIHCAAMPASTQCRIARTVRLRHSGRVYLQVDSLWHDPRRPEVDFAKGLFENIDTLLPSEADVQAANPDQPLVVAVDALLAQGAKTVVLKLGPAGCRIYVKDVGLVAALPVVDVGVADPTGAGDAFCGGFLAGLQATGDLVTAARFGTVSASYAVESPGWNGLIQATPQDANARLASTRR